MKIKLICILSMLSLIVIVNACDSNKCDCIKSLTQQQNSDPKLYSFQNSWSYHIGNFQLTNDKAYLDSAIILIDSALCIEPFIFSAYQYKSMALYWKKEYYDVIKVVDTALSMNYKNPDLIFLKARMYDIVGETEKADATLAMAEQTYTQWTNCFPDSIALITSKIGCTAYIHGKSAALDELLQTMKKHPDDPILEGFKSEIENQFEDSWYYRK